MQRLIYILFFFILLIGCKSNSHPSHHPSIVGTWQLHVEQKSGEDGGNALISFSADGTFSMSGYSSWGEWSMNGDDLHVGIGGEPHDWNLEWSNQGNVVKMSHAFGPTAVLQTFHLRRIM